MSHDNPSWEELPPEEQNELQLADGLLERIKKGETLENWSKIGRAYNLLQALAMKSCGSNAPVGKGYNHAWAHLARQLPHLKGLDKATRSHAMWLARDWEIVKAWHQSLRVPEQLRINHPTTARRRYDAAHKAPAPEKSGPPRVSAKEHQAINNVTPAALADLICETHTRPEYRKSLVAALQKIMERDERQDALEAKAQARSKQSKRRRA